MGRVARYTRPSFQSLMKVAWVMERYWGVSVLYLPSTSPLSPSPFIIWIISDSRSSRASLHISRNSSRGVSLIRMLCFFSVYISTGSPFRSIPMGK